MKRLLLALALAAGLLTVRPAPAAAADPVCPPPAIVVITDLGFFPAVVDAGKSSGAHMRAFNCFNAPVHAFATWTAAFGGAPSSPGPIGCPVIDPVTFPIVFGANAYANSAITYATFATCNATVLHATVTIHYAAGTLAVGATDLAIHH